MTEETREKRVALISFCPSCFGSSDDSSWGESVTDGYCYNCGNSTVITIPRWAVKSIRQQASWVGKRYYPNEEDIERHKELEVLRALALDNPERTVSKTYEPRSFKTQQPNDRGGTTSTWVKADSMDEARIKAKVVLPFRPKWVPMVWGIVNRGGPAIPKNPAYVITIHRTPGPSSAAEYVVCNNEGHILTVSGTWRSDLVGTALDDARHRQCRFPDFMSAMQAAEKMLEGA